MKKLLLVIAVLTMSVSAASATILWDQAAYYPERYGFMDSYSIGPWGDVIVQAAHDFTLSVPATITSVTTYYTNDGQWAAGNYDATLDIYTKTGTTPVTGVDDPLATGTTVSVTLTDLGNGAFELKATGLNIALGAGDYWIMLSPTVPDGPAFREFHLISNAPSGDASASIEFGGWFAPAWGSVGDDGTLVIEGDVVVPTEAVSFGDVKSLYR